MHNSYGVTLLAVALAFCGCGKENANNPPPPAPAPAPAKSDSQSGYLGTLVKGQQTAVKGIDTAALNSEVNLFNVQEGRYPKDLNELVTKGYLGKLPDAPVGMKINYDSSQGKVTVVPQ